MVSLRHPVGLARLAAVLLFASPVLLTACGQDVGERCEQNSDCSSGYCSTGTANVSATGGICLSGPTQPQVDPLPDAGTPDASPVVDAHADVTADAADASDAAGGDAPATDAGVTPDASIDLAADAPLD
jgi:hypothetical protein